MVLVKQLYSITKPFPSHEQFGLTSQIRRAAVSVPANISEGSARKGNKEFIQFLYISLGSLSELDTLVLLSIDFEYITETKSKAVLEQITTCSKLVYGLIRYLKK